MSTRPAISNTPAAALPVPPPNPALPQVRPCVPWPTNSPTRAPTCLFHHPHPLRPPTTLKIMLLFPFSDTRCWPHIYIKISKHRVSLHRLPSSFEQKQQQTLKELSFTLLAYLLLLPSPCIFPHTLNPGHPLPSKWLLFLATYCVRSPVLAEGPFNFTLINLCRFKITY